MYEKIRIEILLKSLKKDVDKNNVVMYNHFCVTPNDVTEYW